MKSTLIAVAANAIIDSQTNALSLIEIIEAFEVPQLPVFVPRLSIVWLITKQDLDPIVSEYSLEIQISGGKKSAFPVVVDFKGGARHRSIVQFQGLAIEATGNLEIKIIDQVGNRKKVIESLSIPIILQGSAPMQASVSGGNQPPISKKKSVKSRLKKS